ncbi:hypothetical protein [Azospirillum argentinense]|uniref:hypothetical protein n=1 Tax=Azospirillum argentinense TaxID=2970906 RepID=UPI0032DF9DC1
MGWYNLRDLESAGRRLNNHLDQKSKEKGEEAARRLMESTSRGRGLWFILHFAAWIIIFAFSAATVNYFFRSEWVGYVSGFIIATFWYRLDFTRKRPFTSFVLGGLVFPYIFIEVMKGQGLW